MLQEVTWRLSALTEIYVSCTNKANITNCLVIADIFVIRKEGSLSRTFDVLLVLSTGAH